MKKYILILLSILLISSVSALTFSGGKIYCFQESANQTNQTGIDGNCNLNYSGRYTSSGSVTNPERCYDGSYSTYCGVTAFQDGSLSIVYIKPNSPILNITGAVWQIKRISLLPEFYELTIPEVCFNYSTTNISLRITSDYGWPGAGQYNYRAYCFNSTDEYNFDNRAYVTPLIYEESIYWDVNTTMLINDINYTKQVAETSTQTHKLNISYDASFYTSYNISLVYNGTSHPVTSSDSGNTKTFQTDVTMQEVSTATNNSFFWNITLIGSTNYSTNTSTFNQTVNPLSIDNCSSYSNRLFNFSLVDEKNQTKLTDGVNIQFYLMVYDSTKTNLIANLSFSSNYSGTPICFSKNFTSTDNLILDGLIRYTATNYEPEYYNLLNIVLNDTTIQRNITLYDILTSESTTFKLTLTGTSIEPIANAIIYVNRKYVSEGIFKTVEAPLTDSKGAVVIHLVNNDMVYQLIAIKDNEIVSSIEITPSCSVTPCTIVMAQVDDIGGILNQYNEYFADNVISSITFNKTTKNLTYTFVDTTATANYFRLVVSKVMYNETKYTVCDSYVYAMAGTIICDLSNYEGDFIAKTYISRSPELTDLVFTFIVESSVIENLGIDIVFFNLCIIIIVISAVAVVSRGTPSSIILSLGIVCLLLKLIGIFPFSWIIVSSIDVLCIYLWRKVRQ